MRVTIPLVDKRAIPMGGFIEDIEDIKTTGVAVFTIEISSYMERIYAYIVPGLKQNLFLGKL